MLMRPGRVHNLLNVLRSWESDVGALRGAIAQVQVPVRLIWGTKDGAVDLRSADALQSALPHCETALLPGWGIWHLKKIQKASTVWCWIFSRAATEAVPHLKSGMGNYLKSLWQPLTARPGNVFFLLSAA